MLHNVSLNLSPGTSRLVLVFSLFVTFCHWTGCLWLWVGELERRYHGLSPATNGWLTPTYELSSSRTHQWLYSFFWAMSCSLGVGCERTCPTNT
jgi:hypothetical protein